MHLTSADRMKKGNEMKKAVKAVVAASLMCAYGCATSPVAFKESSVPVPPQGYTVVGSDVSGSCDQIYVFGLGGSLTTSQQHKAYKDAISQAHGADALVGMCIDESMFWCPPFFVTRITRVTGTPVKFNPPAK